MLLRCLFIGLLALAPTASAQLSTSRELTWLCWLDSRDGYDIRCRLDEDPLAQVLAVEAVASAASPVPIDARTIRREIFRPGRAPNVARIVREQPEQFAPLVWSIPLHAAPFDDSPLGELAQSVMCGSERDCTAFLAWPRQAQPIRIARR